MSSGQVIAYIESVNDQEVLGLMVPEAVRAGSETYKSRPGQVGSYVVIPQKDCKLLALVTAQRNRQPGRRTTDTVEPNLTAITMLMIGSICEGKFHRGINRYPIVGEEIQLATNDDLATIFTGHDTRRDPDREAL